MGKFEVNENIAQARTISTEIYFSLPLFEAMKDSIFADCWQWIGHSALLEKQINCVPVKLLDGFLSEPLVLTRDESQNLHCLPNVCTHRGNLLVTESCQAGQLRCKYHGRLFHLDGRFKSMPEFREVEGFPGPSDSLRELPLFHWGNWLFTSLTGKFPADLFFRDMMRRIEWLPLNEFVFRKDLSKDYLVEANWALYCENYLEGFHIPFVHSGLNAVIDYGDYETELFYPYSSLQIGISKTGEDYFDLPPGSPDFGRKVAAYYFWIFPNMMFNFYPWGCSVNLVEPLEVSKTRVRFLSFVWKDEKRNTGAGGDLDKVEKEDEEIVEKVQQGVRSRFYQHGRYSVTRERGTHHFHRILSSFLTPPGKNQ